jgi:hypothetical protein
VRQAHDEAIVASNQADVLEQSFIESTAYLRNMLRKGALLPTVQFGGKAGIADLVDLQPQSRILD